MPAPVQRLLYLPEIFDVKAVGCSEAVQREGTLEQLSLRYGMLYGNCGKGETQVNESSSTDIEYVMVKLAFD